VNLVDEWKKVVENVKNIGYFGCGFNKNECVINVSVPFTYTNFHQSIHSYCFHMNHEDISNYWSERSKHGYTIVLNIHFVVEAEVRLRCERSEKHSWVFSLLAVAVFLCSRKFVTGC
jgi:hypothetical protein